MKVRDIMRRDFVWFNSGDSFAHVLLRLAQNEISSAPVFHEGEFAGMITAAEMVRYFGRKEFSYLWKKNKPTPIEKIKGTVALEFAKRPARILKPDQKLEDVLSVLASSQGGVPVVENKKMVGLVRATDVIKFFLAEVAKDSHKGITPLPFSKMGKEGAPARDESQAESVNTAIDQLLALVKQEREITTRQAAVRLGLPRLTVERMFGTLSRHHLVKMEYPLFSETIVRLIENDKK